MTLKGTKKTQNEEYPSPSDYSVGCELLESEVNKNKESFSDEDPSIDRDIDERYLIPNTHKEIGKGGGVFNKKQKELENNKKSVISTDNQSCQYEEVQTNMSFEYL
jgi:hypothetical protein